MLKTFFNFASFGLNRFRQAKNLALFTVALELVTANSANRAGNLLNIHLKDARKFILSF